LSSILSVDSEKISVQSTTESDENSELSVVYLIDIYDQDSYTEDELKTSQSTLYLAYQVSIGSFEVLEMGYGEDGTEMIIERTGTLIMQVKLDATEETYSAYGGDE
jgi:hypothetical protein